MGMTLRGLAYQYVIDREFCPYYADYWVEILTEGTPWSVPDVLSLTHAIMQSRYLRTYDSLRLEGKPV